MPCVLSDGGSGDFLEKVVAGQVGGLYIDSALADVPYLGLLMRSVVWYLLGAE